MKVTITPAPLRGTITPPPSKSQAHRVIIAAALSDGVCRLKNVALSEDIRATLSCMRALGADASSDGAIIRGADLVDAPGHTAEEEMDCGESGSTLRFLIPIALALRGRGTFTGHGRLMERPLEPYFEMFREKGIAYRLEGGRLEVSGALTPGVYRLRGDVSSQFLTGLLYALPLLAGNSEIHITTPLESRGYVDMTLQVLAQFGVRVEETEHGFRIPGRQHFAHRDAEIERDYSQAGFYYAARGMGNPIVITGLSPASVQGDRVAEADAVLLAGTGPVTLDVSQCPDLVPALAVQAALRQGERTRLCNAARLRIKESDRLDTVATELNRLGARVEQGPDFLEIQGVPSLSGGAADSHNDHRIAMMLAVAATRADGPVTITGAECVAKSYPDFWEDYEKLGGLIRREE